jgi:hypothetical protein
MALSCQSRALRPAQTSVPGGRSRRALVCQAKKTADGPSIAVVGVTGAVGQEFLQVSISSSSSSPCTLAAGFATVPRSSAGGLMCTSIDPIGVEGEELPLPQHQAAGQCKVGFQLQARLACGADPQTILQTVVPC